MISKIFKVGLILAIMLISSGSLAPKAFACTRNSECAQNYQCIGGTCQEIPTTCPSNQDYCDVGSWITCCAVGYACTPVNGHNECLRPRTPTQPPDEPTTPPATPTPTTIPSPTPTLTSSPFPPSPTPTVIPAQCTNIKMLDPNGVELTGNADATLIPGSSAVKFSCAANGTIAKYEFRVILPDGTIQTEQTDPALAAVGSITGSYIIPTAGKLIVQCRVCTQVGGTASPVCQEYEPVTGVNPSPPKSDLNQCTGQGTACEYKSAGCAACTGLHCQLKPCEISAGTCQNSTCVQTAAPTTAPLIACGTTLPACPAGYICDTTVMAGQPRYCIQPPSQ